MLARSAKAFAFVMLAFAADHAAAQIPGVPPPIVVESPDGKNAIELRSGIEVKRGGRPVLSFDFRVDLADDAAKEEPRGLRLGGVLDVKYDKVDEPFDVAWGKSSRVQNRCSRARVRLVNPHGIQWELELAAYDDGVAYRYRLPQQDKLPTFTITGEPTLLKFAENPTLHGTTCKRFTTDHETEFLRGKQSQGFTGLVDLPLLAVWDDGRAAAITEARVRDFSSLYFESTKHRVGMLGGRLSPLPGRADACVVGRTPHSSPWRVVLLGDSAGELLESNLLVCLNDPPQGDYSWAQPGKTTWHWWNGTAERDLPFPCGMNLATHKHYIDFCARHGITYHAVVADDRPWHVQSSQDFAPGPDTDILTPRAELEFPKLLAYAREKNVGIRLWVHWKALDPRLEEAFERYEQWGIRGLMIDFLDRDDQEMVNFCERVLESAARHKLHIQFHGSYKPSGEWRTFPHLFNREGVLNLEYLKWSQRCTPPHNVEAAYVRALAGPLDYHLGGFRSASRAAFQPRNENPFVLGTRSHHLAMYVVYDNPMPQVCDSPTAYEGQAGFEFIVDVPTTWDETQFVEGDAGDYIVLARRKGTAWYVGGMTDWTMREISVPLSFLSPGDYDARLFLDGSMDEEQPNAIRIEQQAVRAAEPLVIRMAPGGGFAAIIKPK